MKICAPCENKIVVELSAEDMEALDITFDDMDYANIETRRVIWTLLDRARVELGRDIDPCARMLIEAQPEESGGCVLSFTELEEKLPHSRGGVRTVLSKDSRPVTVEFEDSDGLLGFLKCAESFCLPRGEIYRDGNKFRVIFPQSADTRRLSGVYSEFGTVCGEGVMPAEYTREHWRRVG